MPNLNSLTESVQTLVDAVNYKSSRLETVSSSIEELRKDADDQDAEAKEAEARGRELRERADNSRRAANRMIDEEAMLKQELKADEAQLVKLEEIVAGTTALVVNADDDYLDELDDDDDLDELDDDDDLDELAAEAFVNVVEGAGLTVTAVDHAEPGADGTTLVEMDGDEIVSVINEVAGEVASNGEMPSADEVEQSVSAFVDTIRGKHERVDEFEAVKGDASEPDGEVVISAVNDFSEAEAIAAGREDVIKDEVDAAKTAG